MLAPVDVSDCDAVMVTLIDVLSLPLVVREIEEVKVVDSALVFDAVNVNEEVVVPVALADALPLALPD